MLGWILAVVWVFILVGVVCFVGYTSLLREHYKEQRRLANVAYKRQMNKPAVNKVRNRTRKPAERMRIDTRRPPQVVRRTWQPMSEDEFDAWLN